MVATGGGGLAVALLLGSCLFSPCSSTATEASGPADDAQIPLPFRVLIGGCIRNAISHDHDRHHAGTGLKSSLRVVEAMCGYFSPENCSVFLFENDSEDATLAVAQQFGRSSTANFTVMSRPGLAAAVASKRTIAIAHCRNMVRYEAYDRNADFLVMLDMDGRGRFLPRATFSKLFEAKRQSSWDAAVTLHPEFWRSRSELRQKSATGHRIAPGEGLYDRWALRCPGDQDDGNCWRFYPTNRCSRPYYKCADALLDKTRSWYYLHSNFNGFGLYTISPQYQHCRYDGLDWNAHNVPGQDNRYDCEHVALHACLRSVGGRIAVAPYSVTRDAMVATLFPH